MSFQRVSLSKLRRYSRSSPEICFLHTFTSDSHSKQSQNPSYHNHRHNHGGHRHFLDSFSPSQTQLVVPYSVSFHRSFSTRDSLAGEDFRETLGTQFENTELLISENVTGSVEEAAILPVRALISLLDGYHDLTGFPWWIIIASSTVAMRLTLFPFVILQLQKLKRIGELFPKLPPPLPPPMSGRTFRDQLKIFFKEKRAVGCPSFLWYFASLTVQVPCFLLWITTIRRMSLNHHEGFDCGGILWFQNLTEFPSGALGPVFPLLIAGLHYVNVQVSFQKSSMGKMDGLLGLLAKYYKMYLEVLTLPILFITFNIPQGSLVYWLTNSSMTVVQQLSLNHPDLRKKLGLPQKDPLSVAAHQKELGYTGEIKIEPSKKQRKVSVQNLSPHDLVNLSIKFLAGGRKNEAMSFLRLALDKDPEYVRALLIVGQTLLQGGSLPEALEYLERAIAKLLLKENLMEIEDVDLLILSSQWAGVACIRQGMMDEGLVHLERIATLKEPEDPKSKAHYYDGLVLLSSALVNAGRKNDAIKYLQMATAYNESYRELLQQCENEEDDITSDLVSSRRGDY